MKLKTYIITLLLLFLLGISCAVYVFSLPADDQLDNIAVNDIVSDIRSNWSQVGSSEYTLPGLFYGIDYAVIDRDGTVLAATRRGISEDENSAIRHRDTIISITDAKNVLLGSLLFYNDTQEQLEKFKQRLLIIYLALSVFIFLTVSAFSYSLHKKILKPFHTLQNFAQNVAGGNFDLPLPMDKDNVFGAFTESFDLMRNQLAIAKENERKATISKRELVASLSHDIKTPIASIKAIAELMNVSVQEDKIKQQLDTINAKADQINLLITNMFHATLEELQELKVTPVEFSSHSILTLIQSADYRHLAATDSIPDCLIIADPLRLTQVFDNIISNSYKYAGTDIHICFELTDSFIIRITDYGPGVLSDELPLIKQKYYRGKNALNQQGAGIGLYISDYFMEKMQGSLHFTLTNDSFTAELIFSLA